MVNWEQNFTYKINHPRFLWIHFFPAVSQWNHPSSAKPRQGFLKWRIKNWRELYLILFGELLKNMWVEGQSIYQYQEGA